ncbi:DUF4198 domain-containing protein [Mucilaginibacter ginkgonis]|uniref:DUF4198 domain-containing protein n=1 Tax=Mucilaginibacter ginkgonis TaxID=2682091 RepID=A0A7T7FAQ8_9SPHI|nr:DUF4198 domain-containing protein [Mucilaginibacter ginkgonis]QQL49774.1 DUF4198 domain-containing protein [Mucilaginibacter ginkgonis]
MKRLLFAVLYTLCFAAPALAQSDYFLLPENFYPKKADTLKLHFLSGSKFSNAREQKYVAKGGFKFSMRDAGKTVDLAPFLKENVIPVITYKYPGSGIVVVEATQSNTDEFAHREFSRYLSNNGFDEINGALKQFQQSFNMRSYVSLKTIIPVDKKTGNEYEKPLKEDFEIILKQNPYKMNYGDDVTGIVLFKGKPIKGVKVDLLIKGEKTEFPQVLSSTDGGEIYFKLSREGTYLLHAVYLVPGKDQNIDYEKWQTAVTFSFNSADTMPVSYKSFGLGDYH